MKNKIKRRTVAAVLTLLVVGGGATVAATQGSQDDPLITLSYLTDVFKPSVLSEVDSEIEETRQDYLDKLDDSVSDYSAQMEDILGGLSGNAGQNSAVYSVVDLAQGQKLTGEVGCEIMLRIGTANCVSASSPGLIDTTDGSILENGKSLLKNHLYLFTVTDRGVTAASAVKLMVRGGYTIT